MKNLKRVVFFGLILLFTATTYSCSKNNYSHNYNSRSRATASTIDPVSRKSAPVRKNYIVPEKRKKILGQEKPRI